MIDFKNFDWTALQKLANPQAADDLNAFLEKMPKIVGQQVLIAAGIAWAAAGAFGLYTTVQVQNMTTMRAELQEARAVQPPVPKIQDVPVNRNEVESFVEGAREIYRGLDIKANGSAVVITASATGSYAEFREAIGHVQNGGVGWRVNIDRLCVGRECKGAPLGATLKINKVSVINPTQ